MEAAHPTDALDADLDDLRAVAGSDGAVLTAILETCADVPNAADASMVSWAAQRDEAQGLGVPPEVLDAVDPLVPDAHLAGPRLFVLAGEDGVRWSEPTVLGDPTVRWSPLPSLVPVVADRQQRVPILLARCDRRGADVSLQMPLVAEDLAQVEPHEGLDRVERKVNPGGWSQRRFQQRAENTLEGTADDIAEAVAAAAERLTRDTVIVLTGDDRTVDRVSDRIGDRFDVRHVPGGRGRDGSEDAIADEVAEVRAQVAAGRTDAALADLREGLQRGRAVEGAAPVLEALAQARVQRLLVADAEPSEPRAAQADPGTGLPVVDDGAASDAAPVEAPLRDVAVRAALATSASVRVVPADQAPADGVGAVLRWDQAGSGG